ncbi:hypothetical protein Tco_1082689 [Tanacetum coccineum]|uniref:Transposase (Putative), gypsy type n=1 Tax=Tanacetum coccineum TaxID=301880 RepID=A0ABQ5I210_9ASTR
MVDSPSIWLLGSGNGWMRYEDGGESLESDDGEWWWSMVGEGEVSLLQLTRGRIVPLASVNDQGNVNVQGAGNDDVNEEGSDAAEEYQTEQGDHVVQIGGVDIVADDEAEAIVTDQPKKVRKKRKAADGVGGSGLPLKKLMEDYGTSGDAGASTAGKSLVTLQGLLDSSTLAVEVGVTAAATVPFVTSSVTPTLKCEGGGHTESVTGPNLHTQCAAKRFVVLSVSSHHSSTNAADDEVTSIIRSSMPPHHVLTVADATTVIVDATSALTPRAHIDPVPYSIFRDSGSTGEANQDVAGPSHPAGTELFADSFFVSQDVDSETLHQTYIPKWNVTNDSALDEPDICHEFNVGAARQTCLSSEVRLRLEHELRGRRKFEDKCAMQAGWLKERDAEIANLKAAEAAQASELKSLKERNAALEGQLSCDELSIKYSSFEFEKDKLVDQVSKLEGTCSELRDEVSGYKLFKEQIEAVQDVQVKVLSDRVAELDVNLMRMALHLDEEFYPRFLTTIAGRRWILSRGLRLVVMKCLQLPEYRATLGGAIGRAINKGMQGGLAADIDHEKSGRVLIDVAAYDPSAEANYISAVSALRAVNFLLLAQLESYKDASIADIMGLQHLEGPVAEVPEASQLQPSPE